MPRLEDPSFLIKTPGRSGGRGNLGEQTVTSKKSPAHLSFIRTLPCCACFRPGVHAHHLLRGVGRGLSMKSADRWAIPLCPMCHDPNHQGSLHHSGDEEGWFRSRRMNGRAIADGLWSIRDMPEPERTEAAFKIISTRE